MRNYIYLLCLIFILLTACNKTAKNDKQTIGTEAEKTERTTPVILYPSEPDTIQLNIVNDRADVRIHKEERQSVNLRFNSGDYKKVKGTITTTDSISNIRFNQIILPDGGMDGPFGREITYDLPEKGNYILSLHESLMAGDPWAGDFEVIILLSK